MKKLILIPLIFLLSFSGFAQLVAVKRGAKSFNPKLGYYISLPENYKVEKQPLIISLHGTGEGGANLEDLKHAGPIKEIAQGRKVPAIVIAPQYPVDNGWWHETSISWIVEMLRNPAFQEEYNIDLNAVTVTGYSAGARAGEMFAILYPDIIAGVSVVAVRGYNLDDLNNAKDVPFWILTNQWDTNDWAGLIKGLAALGRTAKTTDKNGVSTIWESSSHDSWSRAYRINDLYDWHISLRKTTTDTTPEPEPEPSPQLITLNEILKLNETIRAYTLKQDSLIISLKQ